MANSEADLSTSEIRVRQGVGDTDPDEFDQFVGIQMIRSKPAEPGSAGIDTD